MNISLIKRELTERDRRLSENYILETITIRNNYYGHKIRGEIPIKEIYRIFDTLFRFGIVINAQKFVLDGIEKLLDEYLTQINLDIGHLVKSGIELSFKLLKLGTRNMMSLTKAYTK